MTTGGAVLLGGALLAILYLGGVTLAMARRLSAQLAVLTIRVTDLVEVVDALARKGSADA
jgi:hypothetical protein